jgi:hypothetical protein
MKQAKFYSPPPTLLLHSCRGTYAGGFGEGLLTGRTLFSFFRARDVGLAGFGRRVVGVGGSTVVPAADAVPTDPRRFPR